MKLNTIQHKNYETNLPKEGNYIIGQKSGENIYVYQAFNDKIADFACKNQQFGGPDYSFSRMTWIKPNFLWMMYRCSWGQKDVNQQRVLALEISFTGFEELLSEGVITSYVDSTETIQAWRDKLNSSNVRIQWDPDHDYTGSKLKRRAVQIGIKNEALQKFNNSYLKSITDITEFVKEQKSNIDNNKPFLVIEESVIEVSEDLKRRFSIYN